MQNLIKTEYGIFSPEAGRRVNLTRDYESCALRSFRDAARVLNATLAVDVGANVGIYSVVAASIGSVTAVHAFEPEDEAYRVMTANFALQPNAARLIPHKFGLSSAAGFAGFKVVEPMHGSNGVALGDDATTQVELHRLDDVLHNRDQIICVKIDVEGHELEVLAGATEFLALNRCYLQMEILEADQIQPLTDRMKVLGYRILFVLNFDYIYLHDSLENFRSPLLAEISKNLAVDLRDLTRLRREDRERRRRGNHLS
jgi:FkbM family methyltransferase